MGSFLAGPISSPVQIDRIVPTDTEVKRRDGRSCSVLILAAEQFLET